MERHPHLLACDSRSIPWSSGSLAACLAHPSATSFPGIPLCAGHQRISASTVGARPCHALTGVYLKRTKNRPDDRCWWRNPEYDSGAQQTRDHLLKHCFDVGKVKEETKKGERKWRVGDLLADNSPAVLDFLRSTQVGRTAPPVEGQ